MVLRNFGLARIQVCFLLTVSLLAGCASGPTLEYPTVTPSNGTAKLLLQPDTETTTTAELGQTLISRSFYQTTPAINLKQSIVNATSNNGYPLTMNVPQGLLVEWGHNALGTYYISEKFHITNSVVQGKNNIGGVIVPNDKSPAKFVFWQPEGMSHTFVSASNEPINYEAATNVITPHKENFKRELIYTGVSKNVISIVYREFQNDLARPAFMQELKYDLGEGKVIGFKGARFQVLKATNTGIEYKVLKHLD